MYVFIYIYRARGICVNFSAMMTHSIIDFYIKVFQQLNKEGYLNQQQLEFDQRYDHKISGKGSMGSSGRSKNGVGQGMMPKMIDVDELPVNGRAVPLSSRYIFMFPN